MEFYGIIHNGNRGVSYTYSKLLDITTVSLYGLFMITNFGVIETHTSISNIELSITVSMMT